jgi:16S rRNA (adenine1518-N6/adenine1519-N6)-dimethyltransferase
MGPFPPSHPNSCKVQPDKRLGQHFLHNPRVIERIVTAIGATAGQHYLEIGPGTGALTRPLLATGARVTVLEIDLRCHPTLAAMGQDFPGQLTVLNQDALTADWPALLVGCDGVVGNLPYNVGTEIVANLLTAPRPVPPLTFMLQKEVVQRIAARPGGGTWGRLGVLAELMADRAVLFDVPPGAFTPPPKVMSSIIRLTPLPQPRFPVPLPQLDALLRHVFGQRRKMLRRSLADAVPEALLTQTFAILKIDPTARPETLTTAELCALAKALALR